MAYRETSQIRAKKEAVRERLLAAAHQLVAQRGFGDVSVSEIAELAGVATGSVYRYFPSKAELFSQVFRAASQREVDQVAQAIAEPGSARQRLERALTRFARRALRAKRLAYALIAEPIDPLVDQDRLEYRRHYAEVFERLIREGMASGEFPEQDARIASAALVGAIAETLVGPLASWLAGDRNPGSPSLDEQPLLQSILRFCVNAITGKEQAP